MSKINSSLLACAKGTWRLCTGATKGIWWLCAGLGRGVAKGWRWLWSPVPLALNMLAVLFTVFWHLEISGAPRSVLLSNGLIDLPAGLVWHLSLYAGIAAALIVCQALAARR